MRNLAVFARHQIGAIVATTLDFASMILWVESGMGSAVSGTAIGATIGAAGNFWLSRQWIFHPEEGTSAVTGQVTRYLLVAAASLAWNTLGQKLMLGLTGWPYPVTRTIVSVAVGVGWNYPLHRWFVFRHAHREST